MQNLVKKVSRTQLLQNLAIDLRTDLDVALLVDDLDSFGYQACYAPQPYVARRYIKFPLCSPGQHAPQTAAALNGRHNDVGWDPGPLFLQERGKAAQIPFASSRNYRDQF